ncbi:sensor histidine kinase N-terminal domain-containing protein [Thiofaba sp. EF100]|jgi:two-component system sensor histidine kinase TctE|uniref:sensor histidine kinase N-terminal domain-containing protein n=1 Tax=Thiofaba sp. EF100 TaxID=3121274 RepID=UPI003221AE1E
MPSLSLRARLARWVLLPMIAILVISAVLVYRTTLRLTTVPYDRGLRDTALILQDRLHVVDGRIELDLPVAAQDILLEGPRDELFYAIRSQEDHFIAGHKGLPSPPYIPAVGHPLYFDAHYLGQRVRVAALQAMVEGREVTLLIAETTHERDAISRETTLTLIIPLTLLMSFVLFWMIYGLAHALKPLDRLRGDIARRSAQDLAPLPTAGVPSEVRPLVEEINALLERLAHAQETQRRFIADAAHQLRTPLASLRAYAELAARVEGDTTLLRHDLDRLRAATERAARLVQQLLGLARTEPGAEAGLRRERVRLDALIRERAPDWLHRADARQQNLEFAVEPGEVIGDPFMLGELMDNLVDNALRHTPAGGDILIRTALIDQAMLFEVEDSGPGIPPAQREAVFERFVRLPGSPEGGSGLGLAIVRGIARLHDARIELHSGPQGRGTRLRVLFPAPPEDSPPIVASQTAC